MKNQYKRLYRRFYGITNEWERILHISAYEFLGCSYDSRLLYYISMEDLVVYYMGGQNRIYVFDRDHDLPAIGIPTSYGRMLFGEEALKLIHKLYGGYGD